MLQELKRLLSLYYNKFYSYILTAPPGSLQLTGVLGLAALVIAYYQLRRDDAPSSSATAEQRRQRAQQQAAGLYGAAQGAAAAGGRLAPNSSAAAAAAKAGADGSSGRQQELSGDPMSVERRVRSKLAGIRRVTISSLGPLTEEWNATDLQEGANLRSEAAELLRELCSCADTYVITQVSASRSQVRLLLRQLCVVCAVFALKAHWQERALQSMLHSWFIVAQHWRLPATPPFFFFLLLPCRQRKCRSHLQWRCL
jgi:hypothetical protein